MQVNALRVHLNGNLPFDSTEIDSELEKKKIQAPSPCLEIPYISLVLLPTVTRDAQWQIHHFLTGHDTKARGTMAARRGHTVTPWHCSHCCSSADKGRQVHLCLVSAPHTSTFTTQYSTICMLYPKYSLFLCFKKSNNCVDIQSTIIEI